MELTKEKSEELAEQINLMKIMLHGVDLEYAQEVVKQMEKQASFQESAAVLNMNYNPNKSLLISKQADMLKTLVKFIEVGKEVDDLKSDIRKEDGARAEIAKLFM